MSQSTATRSTKVSTKLLRKWGQHVWLCCIASYCAARLCSCIRGRAACQFVPGPSSSFSPACLPVNERKAYINGTAERAPKA